MYYSLTFITLVNQVMERLTISLDSKSKRAVERLAEKDDRSESYVIRQAVKKYVADELKDRDATLNAVDRPS